MSKRKRIYMDHSSTTALDKPVLKAMLPYFRDTFGNPGSIHSEGVLAKQAVIKARTTVARTLEAHQDEILFTSGGTESNSLAIFGLVKALQKLGKPISGMHFITTKIEHSSVLESFRELETMGARVDYVSVKSDGVVDPNAIGKLISSDTVLISVQYANNEIGTVQPLREIHKQIQLFSSGSVKTRPLFHSDASQAALYLNLKVERLGVHMMTLDGHKMYGPKGIGVLYLRRGTNIEPLLLGGGQERGIRSTTENVPAIVGFSKALELANERRAVDSERIQKLRDHFFTSLLKNKKLKEKVIVNGSMYDRLPNNINISIPGLNTEFAILKLDVLGIACSTKSSCLGTDGNSYVVGALGGEAGRSNSTLRFTLGRDTRRNDIDYLIKCLEKITTDL